jgi:transcriptional regulator with XRE-family HTH domain
LTPTATDEGFTCAFENQLLSLTNNWGQGRRSVKLSYQAGPMPSRNQHKQFEDARQAKEIGERVRNLLGNESVTAFAKRVGISRPWLHDILSGRVSREASVPTLLVIADNLGYSVEWLVTGKGMPNDRWSAETTLVWRFAPKINARKKITLKRVEGDLVLVRTSLLRGFEADVAGLGVLGGENVDLGPIIGHTDEVLVDLKDQKLVNKGLFIAQVEGRLLACRAIKAHSVWLLNPTESTTPDSLIGDYRILGRIRLIWKCV